MSGADSAFEQFTAYARRWAPEITDAELEPARLFRVATAAKGEYLARVGDSPSRSSFILHGLVRQVFVGPDGRERVNTFAADDSLVCTYRARLTLQISDLAIQALDDFADIAPRVPLSQVAAYIGVTPEALSRIRRRLLVAA